MPIEVDETQLASLQNTAKIVQGMLKNPKTRRKVLEAYKEFDPSAAVPELDVTEPVVARMNNLEGAVIEFMKKEREDREKERTESQLERIRQEAQQGRQMLAERGYTPEGISKLEEFRNTKGLVDYNDAVRLWELDNPPPAVAEPNSGMNFFDMMHGDPGVESDFNKRLHDSMGQDDSAVDRMARQAIADMRGAGPRR
jgi:hypothetical protein